MEEKKCANCGTELTGKELLCWGCGVDVENPDISPKPEMLSPTRRVIGGWWLSDRILFLALIALLFVFIPALGVLDRVLGWLLGDFLSGLITDALFFILLAFCFIAAIYFSVVRDEDGRYLDEVLSGKLDKVLNQKGMMNRLLLKRIIRIAVYMFAVFFPLLLLLALLKL